MRPRLITSAALLLRVPPAACGASSDLPHSASPSISSSPASASSSASSGVGPPASPSPEGLRVTCIKALPDADFQIEAKRSYRSSTNDSRALAAVGDSWPKNTSGIAVTNNHVVTGATTVTVWVGQDRAEAFYPRLGRVGMLRSRGDQSEIIGSAVSRRGTRTTSRRALTSTPQASPSVTPNVSRRALSRERTACLTRLGLGQERYRARCEHQSRVRRGGRSVTSAGKSLACIYAGDRDTEQHWAIARDGARG